MAAEAQAASTSTLDQPRLAFFYSGVSGRCRRVEGFLAQVLQRRGNHETFQIYRVPVEDRPDLHERHKIVRLPTLAVIEGKRVVGRLEQPRACREIEGFLSPWMK
jgi:thioredoxin-like negative regulator of GroEL